MTKQYIALGKKLLEKGEWIVNERTKSRCLTLIDETLEYDVGNEEFPLVTTRKSFYRTAIGEMLGYIRGYTSTKEFHSLGVHTWDLNAMNPEWTESRFGRQFIEAGHDLGLIYGGTDRLKVIRPFNFEAQFGKEGFVVTRPNALILTKDNRTNFFSIYESLKDGKDNRGLIWSFWKPELFEFGCLRPCMYEHQFSLVNGKLYLSSNQRSMDAPLGGNVNLVQVYFLLWLMAKLTGHQPAVAKHRIVNIHLYENQLELFKEQMEREPFPSPRLVCHKPITIESVLGICEKPEDNLHPSDFFVEDYQYHSLIKYPFTV